MACEIFISNPIPEQKYYQGLESPAGLSWLKSPAYTPCPEWGFQGEVKERVRFMSPADSELHPAICPKKKWS